MKKLLSNLPDNYIVVMSKDGEGNSYSPLAQVDSYMYVAESTWSGEIRSLEEHEASGYDDKFKENAVVLWPTN